MTFRRETYTAGVLQTTEVWDSVALTYTVLNGQGQQVSQRPLTAPETAEVQARAAAQTAEANGESLRTKAQTALTANQTYLGLAALPAGSALTTTQLTTAVRALRSQVDALTRQNNALIRLTLQQLNDISDT